MTRTRVLVLIVSLPVLVFTLVGGVLGNATVREQTYQHLRIFEDVVTLVVNNYVEEVELDEVMTGAMHGLAEGLDPDSAFLTPDNVREIEQNQQPGPADVGIQLTKQYYLRLIAARDGSPAAKAGLRPGDFVRSIDRKPSRAMSVYEGMRLLRGAAGSTVTLTVIRGNAADPHEVSLKREVGTGADVTSRMQGPGTGYVRVAGFGRGLVDALKDQIAHLARLGATRLLIDVRGAATGDVENGIAAARLFVASGSLGARETRGGEKTTFDTARGDGSVSLPAIVLIDFGSSGAAELFAAALAGNKRAELVGEKTVGRAAAQKLVKLPGGSGLWLTVTRYLTPSGDPIHERGLDPDIEVDVPDVDFGKTPPTGDPILEKAVERITKAEGRRQ